MQYSLFDNRIKKDTIRRVIYQIKEDFDQKNIVRKGCELLMPRVMKDAIGFGSVRDMLVEKGKVKNKHLLEEDEDVPGHEHKAVVKRKNPPVLPKEEDVYEDLIYCDEETAGTPWPGLI